MNTLRAVLALPAAFAIALLVPARAADPAGPILWTAAQLKESTAKLPARVNPELHLATQRLMDSAFILHRNGPSTAEIHDTQADFIVIREGEGAILIGGTIPDAKHTAAGEQRGSKIEGATRYPVAAGDMIYVPANTPHQFLVDPGKTFTCTIVKVTPKP